MAHIKVSELRPAGSELFIDSESFLNDLSDVDVSSVHGGFGHGLGVFTALNFKVLEAGVVGLGITNVVSLVKSFSGGGESTAAGNVGISTDGATHGSIVIG
ncbi:hypothetical protein BZZ01_10080 [Nostocales cyanobacterium HT-58-2]|nr:hypothetical protein BZZ01_10080 [Nostocales cyanobacterium HT-58-2]